MNTAQCPECQAVLVAIPGQVTICETTHHLVVLRRVVEARG